MRKVERRKQLHFTQKLSSGFLSLTLALGMTAPFAQLVHADEAAPLNLPMIQRLEDKMRSLRLLDEHTSLSDLKEKIAITVQLKDEPTLAGMTAPRATYLDESSMKARDLYAKTKQAEFLQHANAVLEPDLETKNHVTLVDNAFTTEVTYEQLLELAQMPEIEQIYHNYPVIARPSMRQAAPHMTTQPGGTAFRMAFDPATAKGQGQVLAIIDSGFDTDHQAMYLSDETVPKLSEEDVASLVNEHQLKGKYYSKKFPYGYNYADRNHHLKEVGESHGTHVAGIAAAQPNENGKNGGVAPEAQVLAMRVFGAGQKGTSPMIYIKAVDDSVKLKASSINMSLGSTYASKDDLDRGDSITAAIAAAKAIGATVNISAGNDGYGNQDTNLQPRAENPHYETIGVPSLAEESISVASIESDEIYSPVMHVQNSADLSYLPGRVVAIDSIYNLELEAVDVKRAIQKDGRDDLADVELEGKAALIERGDITFVDKVNNVAKKGAKLAIIYNHSQGGNDYVNMALDGTTIPAVSLKREDGLALLAKINAGEKPVISVTKEVGGFSYGSAGKLSNFSSWGPTPEFELKPEITAIGGNVYAAQPDDSYGNMSGTSMAAPQVTGAIAVLNQRLEQDDSIEQPTGAKRYFFMKNILMSTAVPHEKDQGEGDPYSSPRKQGAGVMNLDNMLRTKAYATVAGPDPETDLAKVNLGGIGNTAAFKVRVHNISKTETLRFKPSTTVQTDRLDETNPVFIVPVGTRRILEDIQGEEFTVAPGQFTEFSVSFDISSVADQLAKEFINGYFIEGFVRMKSLTEGQPDLGVPYVGFRGTETHPNFYDVPVVEKPIYEFADLSQASQDLPRFYNLEGAGEHPFTALTTTTDRGKTIVLGEQTSSSDAVRRFDKEQLYISPNDDNHYDFVQFQASFTGHYRDAFIRVLNTAGEEVYIGNKSYGVSGPNYYLAAKPETKSNLVTTNRYWQWEGKNKSYQKVEDGIYTLEFSSRGATSASVPRVLRFKLGVDTTHPSLTEPAYNTDAGSFTAKVVETGSGLAEVTLESPAEEGRKDYTKIDVAEDGTITLNRPLEEIRNSSIYLRDRAGNKKTIPLITLLAGDKIGQVSISFQNKAGATEKLDKGLYTVKAINKEEQRVYTDLTVLPFGEYTIQLELNSVVYEVEETEASVTLNADNKNAEVVFVLNKLKGIRTGVRIDFSPRGEKYTGTPKLKATNKETNKSAYLPYSGLYGFLFSFNGELTAGTWLFEVEDLAEGWAAVPSSWELTIKETDKRAPDRTVTLFKGDFGYIRPITIVEDNGFDPSTLKYNAYNGEKIYEGVDVAPVGKYVVFPEKEPEGYYVTPVWHQVSVAAKDVVQPTFTFKKITPERMGKVVVETKMGDGSEPIQATYKALRLQGEVSAPSLDSIAFGTWFVSPDQFDPRYVATPTSHRVELNEDNREQTVAFTWSKLNAVEKKGTIFFYMNQGNPSNRTDFNSAVGEEMDFELEDLDSGEKIIVKAKPTYSGMVTLQDVPFGYYAIRPQCPAGFYTTPTRQYARVDSETSRSLTIGTENLRDFTVERGTRAETSGVLVDEKTNVVVDVRDTVLEGVVKNLHVEFKGEREVVGQSADVYEISLMNKEGKPFTQYTDLAEFKAKVFLPIKEGRAAAAASAYYLPEGQPAEKLSSTVITLNEKEGLGFEVTHFSEYAVAYANTAEEPAPNPGDQPAPNPGDQPAPNPGDQPAPNPGDQPAPNPGDQPAPNPGDQPAPNPGDQPAPNPGDQPAPNPGDQPAPNSGDQSSKQGAGLFDESIFSHFPFILSSETKSPAQPSAKDQIPRTGETARSPYLPIFALGLAFGLAMSFILRRRARTNR